MTTETVPSNPAKFSPSILGVIDELLPERGLVLDPFAGVGGIHTLATPTRHTVGIEIEPEWAAAHHNTLVGDATDLDFSDEAFDVIATSPCYGNRLADHHNARDGSVWRSYTHDLGRPLSLNNTGAMQWGDDYRRAHVVAWSEAFRVLRPGGWFILNVSDHIRGGERVPVTRWHIRTLEGLGLVVTDWIDVPTPRLRLGRNAEARVAVEHVIRLVKRLDWDGRGHG